MKKIIIFFREITNIISLLAIIVSVLSLYFSYTSHKHNILTTKPFLDFDTSNHTIKVIHRGGGLAIMENIFVSFNSGKYVELRSSDHMRNLFKSNGIQGFSSKYSYTDSALSSDDLVIFSYEENSEYSEKTIKNYISQVRFRIKYSGIYGGKYEIDS